MTIYDKSTMSTLYFSKDEAEEHWACTVKIADGEILVEYDEEGLVQYKGKSFGEGHFRLALQSEGTGTATLHMFPDDDVLEGYWLEDGVRGMWRIDLARSEPAYSTEIRIT